MKDNGFPWPPPGLTGNLFFVKHLGRLCRVGPEHQAVQHPEVLAQARYAAEIKHKRTCSRFLLKQGAEWQPRLKFCPSLQHLGPWLWRQRPYGP